MKKLFTLLVLLLLLGGNSWAQTTLIFPTGDGGFENGITPAANNWTAVNATTDSWIVGNVPVPSAGTNCGYVSSAPTTTKTWTYSQISTIEHLYYQDVTVPAGQPKVTISFKWKAMGEGTTTSDWDNMKVFFGLSSAMGIPVANTAISATYQISGPGAINGMYKLNSASWNSETIIVTGTPGSIYRLVFSWKSDVSDIVNPPAALDEVSMITSAFSNITSTPLGGLWNSPATWVGGIVPTYDNVTIASGADVVVNQSILANNLTVDGTLQWITTTAPSTTVNTLQSENITISSTGKLYAHGTVAAGATVKITGNFTNNGVANFAATGSLLYFIGTTGTQTLGGSGTFIADMQGRGMIQQLFFTSLAVCDISTTQNLVTGNLAHTAGSLNTNGKLSIDNTALCFGGLINRSISTVTVNNMGTGYTSAPTVAFTPAPAGGTTATGVANYDAATGTIRSITITNPGDGYRVAPTFTFTGGGGTGLAAVAALYQSFSSSSIAQSQKSAIATITGGININSSQGVGSVFVTNGGVGYTSPPTVGFALPVSFINLVTAGGSGYTVAPAVVLTGGGYTTIATATAVVCQGKVVSVVITGGGTGYTSVPVISFTGGGGGSGATAEIPIAMLPTATANIDLALGMVTSFNVTNPGYGYLTTFPAVTLTGGGYTAAATGATSRHGLYNLIYNYFSPATSNAIHTESAVIPANRRIHSLYLIGATGFGASFTDNLTLYGLAPIYQSTTPTAGFTGVIDLGGNTLTFEHPSYTGYAGSATAYVSNGNITYKLLGSTTAQTRPFPFNSYDGTSGFFNNLVSMGSATTVLTEGSTLVKITGSYAGAPTGTNMIGTRTLRLQTYGGLYGNLPTLRLTWNSVDNLAGTTQAPYLYIAQATGTAGPWTIRSVASGTGLINLAGGNRTTATTAPGPIAITGDDYFGWEYTPPACPPPTAGTTTVITTTSSVLNWTNGGAETLWNVKWGAPGFDPLSGGTLISAISAHPYTLNPPLLPNTAYAWYVQADCGSSQSTWAGPYTFTTLCDNTTLPVPQGFNASTMPSCWSQQFVTGTLSFTFPTTGTGTPAPAPQEGTNQVMFNSYSNSGSQTRLVSPPITTTGTPSVDAQFQWYFSTNGSETLYLTEGVQLQYSTDGTTWINVGSLIRRWGPVNGWSLQLQTLPAGAANQPTVFVGFLFTSNAGYDSYLDAVLIKPTPACVAPTAINATLITNNSATIGWTAASPAPASGYDIYYSTSSTPPTGSTTPTANVPTGTSYPTGAVLTANTPYYVWVRSNCGSSLYSDWTAVYTFTTLCDAITSYPWNEGFEGMTTVGSKILPACWSYENVSGTTGPTSSATSGTHYGPYNGTHFIYTNWANTTWAFTPKMHLTGGVSYDFSFYMMNMTVTDPVDFLLDVAYGTTNSNAGMTNILATGVVCNNAAYVKFTYTIVPVSDVDYFFGVKTTSATSTPWNISFDDFKVQLTPDCLPPTALLTKIITSTTAQIDWTNGGTETKWDVIYGPHLFDPATAGTTISGITVHPYWLGSVTPLTPSTSYDWYVRADCQGSKTVSPWEGPKNFTTLAACPAPSNLGAPVINVNSADLAWTENGSATTWDIELRTTGSTFNGTPTQAGVIANPYTYGSLLAGISYTYYVRADCGATGGTGTSLWAGPFTFVTLCGVSATPFIEGFEGTTFAPVCWTNIAVSGTYLWTRSTAASGYGIGAASAYANFYSQSSGTYELTTPQFDISGLTNPKLKFNYAYATYSGEVDQMDVYYSVNNGTSWLILLAMPGGTSGILNTGGTTTAVFVPTPSQWGTQDLVLPAGTNKVKFRAISAYGNNLYLDNVEVYQVMPHDVSTVSIDNIPGNVGLGLTYTPKATVKNNGTFTETNFTVTLTSIPAGYSSTQTIASLAPGLTTQVIFDTWTPSALGSLTLQGCTNLAGDGNTSNDCASINVEVFTPGSGTWSSGSDIALTTGHYLGSGVGYTDNAVSPPVGYLFAAGGNDAPLTDFLKYNETTNTWTVLTNLPAGRVVHTSACVGNFIYIIGGSDGTTHQSTVFKYDITNTTWTTVAPLPVAIAWCKAVAHGTNIYVAGGESSAGSAQNTVFVYNTLTDIWATATPMPGARLAGAFSCSGDKLVYVGGIDDSFMYSSLYVGTINPSDPTIIAWATAKSFNSLAPDKVELPEADSITALTVKGSGSGNSSKSLYPGGPLWKFDAAPWGTDGVIITTGTDNVWAPFVPNPCFIYKPATDTWLLEPYLPIPVLGSYLGSVDLVNSGTHTWKLFVASGLTVGSALTKATQVLTEVMAPATKTLTVTAFLEGLYAGSGTMNQAYDDLGPHFPSPVADQVYLELHNGTTYGTIEYPAVPTLVNISTSGIITVTDIPASLSGSYYITIRHRNSIETTSAVPVSFAGTTVSYDFSTAASQAYGDNMKLMGTVYAIYTGDINQDNLIDGDDQNAVETGSTLAYGGYIVEDVNGSGLVDSDDQNLVENNSIIGIMAIIPFP